MCECVFKHMHVLVPAEARRVHQIPWSWSYMQSEGLYIGTRIYLNLGPQDRIPNVLSCWALFRLDFLKCYHCTRKKENKLTSKQKNTK